MGLISHEGIGMCTGIQDGGADFFNSFLVRSLLWEGKIVKKSFDQILLLVLFFIYVSHIPVLPYLHG